ncbi:MAG TPA: BadF/BadG/BcrA/BcrD ATPase family protein [Chthonomonadales bacterium]|nr:BadF/BadG/BcrA/BcrD ATPase family protein [Chthonomonadales bacterium]
MRWVLAVDTGGSKCEAVLADDAGAVVGWGRCDYTHPDSGRGACGSGRASETVSIAVRDALAGHDLEGELHLANGRRLVAHLALRYPALRVVAHDFSEAQGALALAGEPCGVVALAGTGALVSVTRPDGQTLTLDALGPLLGDHGSGFHIGLLAVRAVGRARWSPRNATSLEAPVIAACSRGWDQNRPFGLVEWMLHLPDRSALAALARIVDAEARAGDCVAIRILREAARALAATLRDAVEMAGVQNEPLPLVGTGSVAARSRIYWAELRRQARRFAPELRPVVVRRPAALGYVLATLASLGTAGPDPRRRVMDTAARFEIEPPDAAALRRQRGRDSWPRRATPPPYGG